MEYMIQAGFLGTRAPFFMDIVVIIVALLPFLISLGIWFARLGYHKLHHLFQTILFVVTVVVLIYFEYGIKLGGGFKEYIKDSSIEPTLALYFLIFHIIIATITMIIWGRTLKIAFADRKRRTLPGLYSKLHRKTGKIVAFFILLTSITGVGVYWMLFIG